MTKASDIALALAAEGYAVMPVSIQKTPVFSSPHKGEPKSRRTCKGECGLVGHGVYDASKNPAKVAALFAAAKWAEPAIACGASGIVVLDVDGPEGEETLTALVARYGPLPATREVKTGRVGGGRHLWFKAPEGPVKARRLHKIDVKAGAAYAVAPGARHKSGAVYTVVNPAPVAPAPEWLADLIRA